MVEHIQIKGVTPRIQYIADGTTTEFEFPFAIFKSTNLSVYLNDILQDASTYLVNGEEKTDGGNVVFLEAPIASTQITLCRNLKVERLSDFQEGVTLRANVLNDELDYQTACIQELAENLNRSVILPPYATDTNVDLTLPSPEAGKAIIWNNEGTNLENSTITINTLEDTFRNYKEVIEEKSRQAALASQIAQEQAQEATKQAENATLSATLSAFEEKATNCFIEIPQNIKLELSNGILTLKKGSKVYIPKGNNVYQVLDITSDVNPSYVGSGNYNAVIFYSDGVISLYLTTACYSGATNPNATISYSVWFDTSSCVMKETKDTGKTWAESVNKSLPLAIISVRDGIITEIKKIFNGFGYIGSTSFILPGCKALVPDGRNENGTLKNRVYTVPNVLLHHKEASWTQTQYCYIDTETNLINGHADYNVFIQEECPDKSSGLWYKPSENIWRLLEKGNSKIILTTKEKLSSGLIIEQSSPKTFQTLSYEDSECITNWMMPDYSSAISLSAGTYTFSFDAYCSICLDGQANIYVSVYLNDKYIGGRGNSASYYSPNSIDVWLPKHTTLRIEGSPSFHSFYCPLKGKK